MFLPEEISQYFLLVLRWKSLYLKPVFSHLQKVLYPPFFYLEPVLKCYIFLHIRNLFLLFQHPIICYFAWFQVWSQVQFYYLKSVSLHHLHSRKTPDEKLIHGRPTLIFVQIPWFFLLIYSNFYSNSYFKCSCSVPSQSQAPQTDNTHFHLYFFIKSTALCPPNPRELLIA